MGSGVAEMKVILLLLLCAAMPAYAQQSPPLAVIDQQDAQDVMKDIRRTGSPAMEQAGSRMAQQTRGPAGGKGQGRRREGEGEGCRTVAYAAMTSHHPARVGERW